MKKLDSGKNHARYAIGELVVVALRDGYVDMPTTRPGAHLDFPGVGRITEADGGYRYSPI
jgi:hypothetical protein